jgi:hypothetical protein
MNASEETKVKDFDDMINATMPNPIGFAADDIEMPGLIAFATRRPEPLDEEAPEQTIRHFEPRFRDQMVPPVEAEAVPILVDVRDRSDGAVSARHPRNGNLHRGRDSQHHQME